MKKDLILYHGSSTKIRNFEINKSVGNDQYGPGIYFSDEIQTTKSYGRNIHICKLDKNRLIHKKDQALKYRMLINRILNENVTQDHLDDWGYTKKEFLKYWNDEIITHQSMTETLEYIWKDIFNLDNKKFCAVAVRHGIDGVIHPQHNNENFYVVFNPRIIHIQDITTL